MDRSPEESCANRRKGHRRNLNRQIKAFKRASSPANFICVFRDTSNTNLNGCKIFATKTEKSQKLTVEQLTLDHRRYHSTFVCCPI
ncbi:hypothetical protein niasHT_035915 [Heterodera trifolii]|uniref:Uncharacterized protein n=1 Tax=Heterodera trifolii TaxID=157864 RepID=A0ABD2IHV7_9BILA